MKYKAEDILEENYGDDVTIVQDGKITGQWRWGTAHETVVRIDGEFYAVNYRVQPERGVQDHSDLYRVIPHEMVVTEYVRMREAP